MFLPQKKEKHKEAFGGDECIYWLYCGDGFTGFCVQIQTVYLKYVQIFVYQLHLNKDFF